MDSQKKMNLQRTPWLSWTLLGAVACSGGGGRETAASSESATSLGATTGSTSATGTGTTAGSDSASAGPTTDTTGPACDPDTCDGVCTGDVCCDADLACGDVCCDAGDVCSFGSCVTPGQDCIDASECAEDEYCEYALGEDPGGGGTGGTGGACMGGAEFKTGKCLPKPPECPDGQDPGDPPTCIAKCEYVPPPSFEPELKFAWTDGNVMMAPVVIQLDDDNCDGVVDEKDIPEIVFSTFAGSAYNNDGTLHAISIVDGAVVHKWQVTPATDAIWPGRSIAAGDIDGDGGNEIVTCTDTGKVRAFDADGTALWVSSYAGGCFMPSIADFDQDGTPEILVKAAVLDGPTGATKATLPNLVNPVAADVDADGVLEVVGPTAVYEADGTEVTTTPFIGNWVAVADFDLDTNPEIAVIDIATHSYHVWRVAPALPAGYQILRQGVDINGPLSPALCPPGSVGSSYGGGPPTIADFNGDGVPDLGVAGGVGYAVFDGVKIMDPNVPNVNTILWITQTKDCSSAQTGSAVFDFDGDGSAEVVYSDEHYLRIYRGSDGTVLWQTCNTTGTLQELPVVADVDNDGHADIVAVSNDYSSLVCPENNSKQRGVRIFGDAEGRWVRTRRIWNQHPYHVTNVEEDGSIPAVEAPNWTQPRLNNFRQNVQPLGEFSAPDLVATIDPYCGNDEYGLVATVRNIGQAAVPPGVPVGFYAGNPMMGGTLLGTLATTKELYSAEAEQLYLPLPNPPAGVMEGTTPVFVVVDDGMPPHPWKECRTDNNVAEGTGQCNVAG